MNENLIEKEQTLDSREVAEMCEMEHSKLLRKIDDINKSLSKSNIGFCSLWQENSYINVNAKNKPCRMFNITKKGCEFLANKLTGDKGNIFTFKYVERFNNMEQHIVGMTSQQQLDLQTQTLQLAQGMQMIGQVVQGIQVTMSGIQNYVKDSINSKDIQIEQAIDLIGMRDKNVKRLTQSLKDKLSDLKGYNIKASDEIYQSTKKKVLKEFNVIVWEDIPVNKFNHVHAYIDTLEKDDV